MMVKFFCFYLLASILFAIVMVCCEPETFREDKTFFWTCVLFWPFFLVGIAVSRLVDFFFKEGHC